MKNILWLVGVVMPVIANVIVLSTEGTLMTANQWILVLTLAFYGSSHWLDIK